MMKQLTVNLGDRRYPISIDVDLLTQAASFASLVSGDKVLVITNTRVAPLYLAAVMKTLLSRGVRADKLILPDGEQYKTLQTFEQIIATLLAKGHGRDTTLIALGGGVIGDLTGFSAACYQRGVKFIQIPTTLLAQVDSSVGGKTGVNHPLGKNMVGAFYQPDEVLIDINTLKTLSVREFSCGLAEVIKYGVALDGDFFEWLESNLDRLLAQDVEALGYCIFRCCELKAQLVAEDERDHGRRALLNLGHTFGHAIEAELGYGVWHHGEAVAVGMLMAAKTALLLGEFSEDEFIRLTHLLEKAGLPVKVPSNMASEAYLPHMLRDKKTVAGELRLILPTKLGNAQVCCHVSRDKIAQAIELMS